MRSNTMISLATTFMLGLFSVPEDEGDMFFQNVG
jgi:hypothetical protein